MSQRKMYKLSFIVANDSEHDFDLVQEAWLGDWMVAMLYRVGYGANEEWHISFFSEKRGSQECELS